MITHMDSFASRRKKDCDESEDDESESGEDLARVVAQARSAAEPSISPESPQLTHRFRHDQSILCLAVTGSCVFAGSQNGDILVYDLGTYERTRILKAHESSVLGLCLAEDDALLFSSASDRVVNIWNVQTYEKQASLTSQYDVGDLFCVSYSSRLHILYLGCQNTSIQWIDLRKSGSTSGDKLNRLPYLREDKFFGSAGPGGVHDPQQTTKYDRFANAEGHLIEIPKNNVHHFAHYGYVNCMLLCPDGLVGHPGVESLISGGGDGDVSVWALDEGQGGQISHSATLRHNAEDAESILSMVLEGTMLFTGRVGGEINAWDLETRQLLRSFRQDNADILSLAVSRECLISLSEAGLAMQYNQRYECTASWSAHAGRALAAQLRPSAGRMTLMTGGSDNTIALWSLQNPDSPSFDEMRNGQDGLLNSLRRFVAFRSVSSDPQYQTDCRKCASFLRALFKGFGAETQMITTEAGLNPIIYASFRGKLSSTEPPDRLLFYGHYDVISANNKHGKWVSEPFHMTGLDGYLYGRGISDNKGPLMAAIYAVADIISTRKLTLDITFLIEGEEESGSRGFKEAIRRHKDLIGKVDWILLANSYWLDDEIPCLTYGLRGVIHAGVEVNSDQPDLHSGVDGSRLLDEPLKDLVALIARLSGPDGHVRLPGFYSGIKPVSQRERTMYSEISESLLARKSLLGSPKALTESLMARWREPSLTVHGFGTSGSEKATIIPHRAHVSLSLRLVPGQDSENISTLLQSFLREQFELLQSKTKLTITVNTQSEPWLGDPANRIFRTLERAIIDVWSRRRRKSSASEGPISPTLISSKSALARSKSKRPESSRQPATSSMLASNVLHSAAAHSDVLAADGNFDWEEPLASLPVDLCTCTWKPLYIREGGSIPAIRFLEKELGAPAAHLPCGQASDNAHLENERLRVLNLLNSRQIFMRVFTGLA